VYKECKKKKVISVTTGPTGTISKIVQKYLSNIPGKNDLKELQKTAILTLFTYFGKY
jgi:hypothetical protein